MTKNDVDAIARKIKQGNRFLLAAHLNPDGDAIGSTLALMLALEGMGKEVVAYNRDGVPNQFSFLPGADLIVKDFDDAASFDVLVVLDCSELERVSPDFEGRVKAVCRINIDHHLTNRSFADLAIVDKDACSTGYLVHRLILALPVDMNLDIATNIYATILYDTGCFRYSNSTPEAFRVAGELIGMGVSPWGVANGLYENQPLGRIKLLAKVLDTLYISKDGTAASVTVTKKMFAETGTGHDATDGFVNYPRSIEGVEVAFLIRETGADEYKVSFRSMGKINVAAVAERFGGGGHRNAAGCMMRGPLDEVRKNAFSAVSEAMTGE